PASRKPNSNKSIPRCHTSSFMYPRFRLRRFVYPINPIIHSSTNPFRLRSICKLGPEFEIRDLSRESKGHFEQVHSPLPYLQFHVPAIQNTSFRVFHKSTHPSIHSSINQLIQ